MSSAEFSEWRAFYEWEAEQRDPKRSKYEMG